ncbi:hypothetical protein P4S72_29570 [Vibrio sp. PP-XX7]
MWTSIGEGCVGCRIVLGYLLGIIMDLGVYGIWLLACSQTGGFGVACISNRMITHRRLMPYYRQQKKG